MTNNIEEYKKSALYYKERDAQRKLGELFCCYCGKEFETKLTPQMFMMEFSMAPHCLRCDSRLSLLNDDVPLSKLLDWRQNLIKILNANGINSIDDLLSKTKEEIFSIKGLKAQKFTWILDELFSHGYMPSKQWGTVFELRNSNYQKKQQNMFSHMFNKDVMVFENFNDFSEKSLRSYDGEKPYPSSNTWLELVLFENYFESDGCLLAMSFPGFLKRSPSRNSNTRLTVYYYKINESDLAKLNDFYTSIGMKDYIDSYPFSITTDINMR